MGHKRQLRAAASLAAALLLALPISTPLIFRKLADHKLILYIEVLILLTTKFNIMEQLKTRKSTAIDSATAEQWARNWLEFIAPLNEAGNSTQPNFVSSFRVPLNNLVKLNREREVTTIRLYLAREDGEQPNAYGACKLIWVPLAANGNELHKVNYQSAFFYNDQNIPAGQASRWIENWRNFIAPYNRDADPNQPHLVYSFRLNMEDFISLYQEKGISAVYMFLGKEDNGCCKLFWVPLDEKDHILTSATGQITAFDFSHSCPPDCGFLLSPQQ